MKKRVDDCTVVDIFAGAGGLTHGFAIEGFRVVAGIDADASCEYPYETNNSGSRFIHKKIEDVSSAEILELFPDNSLRVSVGCAPCQPFSSYTRKTGEHDSWRLLYDFSNLIHDVQPTIVSMENVPRLATYDSGKVYEDFIRSLEDDGYTVSSYPKVYAPNYGTPQHRTRLILFASKWGGIELLEKLTRQTDIVLCVRPLSIFQRFRREESVLVIPFTVPADYPNLIYGVFKLPHQGEVGWIGTRNCVQRVIPRIVGSSTRVSMDAWRGKNWRQRSPHSALDLAMGVLAILNRIEPFLFVRRPCCKLFLRNMISLGLMVHIT